jgi:hypothetical protein
MREMQEKAFEAVKNKIKNILQKTKTEKLVRLNTKREWILDEI